MWIEEIWEWLYIPQISPAWLSVWQCLYSSTTTTPLWWVLVHISSPHCVLVTSIFGTSPLSFGLMVITTSHCRSSPNAFPSSLVNLAYISENSCFFKIFSFQTLVSVFSDSIWERVKAAIRCQSLNLNSSCQSLFS